MRSNGLEKIIKAAGGYNVLARKLGISNQAVRKWRRVPRQRLARVERLTGVPRQQLRPDLYAGMK